MQQTYHWPGLFHDWMHTMEVALAAAELAHETGNLHMEGDVRADLGVIHARRGQYDEAVEQLEQALDLFRRVGQRPMEADTLLALGDALAGQGRDDAACDAWRQAYLMYSAFRQPQTAEAKERLLKYGRPVPELGGDLTLSDH